MLVERIHQGAERGSHVLCDVRVVHQGSHRNSRYFGIHPRTFKARLDRHPDEVQLVVGVGERIGEQGWGDICNLVLQFAGNTGFGRHEIERGVRRVLADQENPGLRLRIDFAYQVLVAVLDRILRRIGQFDLCNVLHRDSALRPPVHVGQQSIVRRKRLVEETGNLGVDALG